MDRVTLSDKTYRIISSQFPPITLFETCLDTVDLEVAYALESLTNDRLRDEAGDLRMINEEDRISGPNTTPVMAAFTHYGQASRFTNGTFGVYYAALDVDTAIAETRFWQEKFMLDSDEPAMTRDMRLYCSNIQSTVGSFVDLRSDVFAHSPSDYAYSQAKASQLRNAKEYGIYYKSVRREEGECIAAFRPSILGPAIQSAHYRYYWDGECINRIEKIEEYNA